MYVLVCDLDDDGDLDFVSVDALLPSKTGVQQSSHSIVYYENVGSATNPEFIQHREKELNPFYAILKRYPAMIRQYDAQLVDIDGDGTSFCSHWNELKQKTTHVSLFAFSCSIFFFLVITYR